MTYATMRSSGRGKLVYWLRIGGIPAVFATEDLEPPAGDTWYWNGAARRFLHCYPWLEWPGLAIDERCSFIEGTLDVEPLSVEIADVAGGLVALTAGWHRRVMTRLRQTLVAGAVAGIEVESTASFPATGVVWIGLEAIWYDGADANTLGTISMVRGYYGSHDVDHVVDTGAEIPVYPAVLDGPQTLVNRRADLFASEVDSAGQVSASECIFRGYVATDLEWGEGCGRLKIDHISRLWSRQVGLALPEVGVLRGYYFSGSANVLSPSTFEIQEIDTAAGGRLTATVTLPRAYYPGYETLRDAVSVQIETAAAAAGFNREIHLLHDAGTGRANFYAPADATYEFTFAVAEGDPLWCLGYRPGSYNIPLDGAGPVYLPADDDPVPFCLENPDPRFTSDNAVFDVEDGTRLTSGSYLAIGQNPYMQITGIVANRVTLTNGSMDPVPQWQHARWPSTSTYISHVAITDADELVARHLVVFPGEDLGAAIQRMCCLAGTEPQSWKVLGFISDDYDFTELANCFTEIPYQLTYMDGGISAPMSIADIICDRLGVLGIAPRLTDDGRIGFARIRHPHTSRCSAVEVDDQVWEHISAAKTTTIAEGEPLLNEILLDHTYSYIDGSWAQGVTRLVYDDGMVMSGKPRAKRYRLFGVHVVAAGSSWTFANRLDLIRAVQQLASGLHFGVYGRLSSLVAIGATWTSRQHDFDCGEQVLLTHPCVVDPIGTEGAAPGVGVDERVAVVVGRRCSLTEPEADSMQFLLPVVTKVGQIAPCALATAWNAGLLRLTFASTTLYCQAGEDDLDGFAAGMAALVTEYDARVPAQAAVTIAAVGAGWVDLTADPFGGAFPTTGVWLHYPTYPVASAAQRAWLYFADTTYGLGAAPDPGYRWGI